MARYIRYRYRPYKINPRVALLEVYVVLHIPCIGKNLNMNAKFLCLKPIALSKQNASFPYSDRFKNTVLSYVTNLNRRLPLQLAVDVTSDGGKSTILWSDAFKRVYGVYTDVKPCVDVTGKRNVTFIRGGPDRFPFENGSVDFVLIGLNFLWILNKDYLFCELHRVLKPEGVFCVHCPKYLDAELDKIGATQCLQETVNSSVLCFHVT